MEFIVYLLVEIVGQAAVEVCWRLISVNGRDVFARPPEPARWVRVVALCAAALAACIIGFWRGVVVTGVPWGMYVGVGVAAVAAVAWVVATVREPVPRPQGLAVLRWWPASRCRWFAVTNMVFAASYWFGYVGTQQTI